MRSLLITSFADLFHTAFALATVGVFCTLGAGLIARQAGNRAVEARKVS